MPPAGERTEAPTPRRLAEARERGDVPVSRDAAPLAVLVVAALVASVGAPAAGGFYARLAAAAMATGAASGADGPARGAVVTLGAVVLVGFLAVVVVGVVAAAVSAAVTFTQTRGVLASERLKPSWERINPVAGLRRLVSLDTLWETLKALIKVAVIGTVGLVVVVGAVRDLAGPVTLEGAVFAGGRLVVRVLAVVGLVGLVLVVPDWAWARWRWLRRLRMTRQELKEDLRRTEGDPHLRARIRARAREITRNRMIAAVRDATVVVTNPTTVAVALAWDGGDTAPRVVASGRGSVAERIRAEAARWRIPVVRVPPLARALEAAVHPGEEIPHQLYLAVAKVLVWVERLGAAARAGIPVGGPPLDASDLPAVARRRRRRAPRRVPARRRGAGWRPGPVGDRRTR